LDGIGGPQLKDVLELKKASEKLHLPLKEKQVQKTIEAFAVTLRVLCGTASGLFQEGDDSHRRRKGRRRTVPPARERCRETPMRPKVPL
jgi:hypothetical protein